MGARRYMGATWALAVPAVLLLSCVHVAQAQAPTAEASAAQSPTSAGRAPAAVATNFIPSEVPAPPTTAAEALSSEPLYAAPTRIDRAGRIVASVEVNGRGPFRFIVDTGANRSAVSEQLAEQLQLLRSAVGKVDLHGVTGNATLPSVDVEQLRAGELVIDPGPVPILARQVFADTDGILGMEGFGDYRIDVDFKEDRVSIERSNGKRPRDGFVLVHATTYRGLLVVDGAVGGVKVKAIVDTGAERTIGNAALRDALLRQARSRHVPSRVTGATEQTFDGTAFIVPAMRLGSARLTSLPVTFGDMHVFGLWGFGDVPAMLIGMDLIGRLHRFAVDYRRSEIQLMPYSTGRSEVRRCGPTECQSRIPSRDGT